MRVEVRERLDEIAEVTAARLVEALQKHTIERVDIVVIKRELRLHSKFPKDFNEREYLEDKTTRRVVEMVDSPPLSKVHY